MLGHVFPAARVISLESEPASERAGLALARVAHLPNVDCRFGDSRQLLPDLLEPGCVAMLGLVAGFIGMIRLVPTPA